MGMTFIQSTSSDTENDTRGTDCTHSTTTHNSSNIAYNNAIYQICKQGHRCMVDEKLRVSIIGHVACRSHSDF